MTTQNVFFRNQYSDRLTPEKTEHQYVYVGVAVMSRSKVTNKLLDECELFECRVCILSYSESALS